MTTLHTSTEGTALVGGNPLPLGCHIDGGVRTVELGTLDMISLAAGLMGEHDEEDTDAPAPRVAAATEVYDRIRDADCHDYDAPAILQEMGDEAEAALNAATEDGYSWSWDGDLFLARVETFEAEVRRIEDYGAFLSVSSVGAEGADVSAERADYIAQAIFTDDESGEVVGEVWAVWYGEQAPYVNLYSFGTEDGSDYSPNLQGVVLSDPTEALHIGDGARSPQLAHDRFLSFCQDYLDNPGMVHDFTHYGFAR